MKPESFRRLASRMSHIAPFEVMEIQTAARELERQGKDVIHMEIGEPDFTTPQPIVNAAIAALQTKPMFYTSALGIQPLREAIAAFYASKYGFERFAGAHHRHGGLERGAVAGVWCVAERG